MSRKPLQIARPNFVKRRLCTWYTVENPGRPGVFRPHDSCYEAYSDYNRMKSIGPWLQFFFSPYFRFLVWKILFKIHASTNSNQILMNCIGLWAMTLVMTLFLHHGNGERWLKLGTYNFVLPDRHQINQKNLQYLLTPREWFTCGYPRKIVIFLHFWGLEPLYDVVRLHTEGDNYRAHRGGFNEPKISHIGSV